MTKKLNYHKVLFTLQTFSTPAEKISYLLSVKVDINRIIKCFSGQKFQSLKKYAVKNIFAEDGCDELTDFLKEVITYYNSPQFGDRYISDAILKRHLKEEVVKYKNFLRIVDSELDFWISQRDGSQPQNEKNENEYKEKEKMNESMLSSKKIEESNKKLDENSTSMRELIDSNKSKIKWKGSKEDLIHFFDQLFNQQLLNIKSYDEIFSIAAHYFVDENNEPIIIEKSAAAKMNLNGPKIPEGYQRYMKSIEKLKSGQ